eukprot:500202_1
MANPCIIVLNTAELQHRQRHAKQIATQLHDQLASFRTRPFKINGIEIQPKTEFKLLGQWFDDKWTFNKQITTRIQAINLIRINALKLLKASNHALNLGLIKTYLSSSALSLLNYAGCILYTVPRDRLLGSLRTAYNRIIHTMNRYCYTTTLMERTHFNGFFSFDAYCKNLVAKQFSRFIRNNNQNGLSRIKSAKIR